MADALGIGDLIDTAVTFVKNTYCPATLSNNSAMTCGVGAGGFAFALLAFLIIVAFPLIKDIATEGFKQRRIGLAVMLAILVLSFSLPASYAVLFALIPIAIWILFAQPLSQRLLHFRTYSLTLDIFIITLAPFVYLFSFGAQWGLNKLFPPPPAILLLPAPNESSIFQNELKDIIKQIRADLGDLVQTYELLPNDKDIDSDNFFSHFGLNWNDANSLARSDADLKTRKIEFIRSGMSGTETTAILNAEARTAGLSSGAVDYPLGTFQGVKQHNEKLMSLLLRLSVVGHYATGVQAGADRGLSQTYISEFKTAGAHLLANVPATIQDALNSPSCSDLKCVQTVASAFQDALVEEYKAAQPALAQRSRDNADSQATQFKLDSGQL